MPMREVILSNMSNVVKVVYFNPDHDFLNMTKYYSNTEKCSKQDTKPSLLNKSLIFISLRHDGLPKMQFSLLRLEIMVSCNDNPGTTLIIMF